MLTQKTVLDFINLNRSNNIDGCNFFYKSHNGHYLDANERTAHIAGVELSQLAGKADIELKWSEFSRVYKESDEQAIKSRQPIIKIEDGLNRDHQHKSNLTVKSPVIGSHGAISGIFGAVLYIEEVDFFDLFQIIEYLYNSLGINAPLSASKQLIKNPAPASSCELSKREKDCAYFLCQGMTAKEIALKLKLSHRTIESYISNMKDKLYVRSKSELISKLVNQNMLNG